MNNAELESLYQAKNIIEGLIRRRLQGMQGPERHLLGIFESPENTEMETIKERYTVVSDGRESSVFDHRESRDLFPTKSGNRDYQCQMARPEDVEHIARCLNLWQQVHGDYRPNAEPSHGPSSGS